MSDLLRSLAVFLFQRSSTDTMHKRAGQYPDSFAYKSRFACAEAQNHQTHCPLQTSLADYKFRRRLVGWTVIPLAAANTRSSGVQVITPVSWASTNATP